MSARGLLSSKGTPDPLADVHEEVFQYVKAEWAKTTLRFQLFLIANLYIGRDYNP